MFVYHHIIHYYLMCSSFSSMIYSTMLMICSLYSLDMYGSFFFGHYNIPHGVYAYGLSPRWCSSTCVFVILDCSRSLEVVSSQLPLPVCSTQPPSPFLALCPSLFTLPYLYTKPPPPTLAALFSPRTPFLPLLLPTSRVCRMDGYFDFIAMPFTEEEEWFFIHLFLVNLIFFSGPGSTSTSSSRFRLLWRGATLPTTALLHFPTGLRDFAHC